MQEKTDSAVKLCSYQDDIPRDGKGTLIPRSPSKATKRPCVQPDFIPVEQRKQAKRRTIARTASAVVAAVMLIFLSTAGYGLVASTAQVASPVVSVTDPSTSTTSVIASWSSFGFYQQLIFY
jgi:cobyrinic acid a,c-diamide synthase